MRHRDVGDDHVRPQPLRGLDERPAVFDDTKQLELLLEQTLQALRDQTMVIGKQDSRAFHGALVLGGRRQRHPRRYGRALPGLLLMFNRPRKQPDSFFHARMPQAGTRSDGARIKTVPVVVDRKYQPAVLRRQRDRRDRCARVTHDVAQRLLRDTENTQ